MKDTLIPLDMLFIDEGHRIVTIQANATPNSETPIPSGKPVIAVIELAGGRATKDAIAVGDTVEYELPAKTHVE